MTTIIKSNVALSAPSLGTLDQVTKTAQEIYDTYAARVVADGGAVQDATRTLAAITSAIEGGYFFNSEVAVSPQWGVKVSGSNIIKEYGLNGKDGTVFGTIALDTTTAAYPTAVFNSINDYIEFEDVTLNRRGRSGAVLHGVQSALTSVGNTFDWTDPNGIAYYVSRYQVRLVEAGAVKLSGPPDFGIDVDEVPNWHFDHGMPRAFIGKDGTMRKSAAAYTPFGEDTPTTLKLGSISNTAHNFVEGWWLGDATIGQVQALAADVKARS